MTNPRPGFAVVLGEALTDIVVEPGGSREHPGGSPMNVSLGLARLGVPVTFGTQLGDDSRGDAIREHLTSSGVTIVPDPAPGSTTSTAAVELDADGVARYQFDVEFVLDVEPSLADVATHVHFGSIGAFLQPGAGRVEQIARAARPHATISYDPNIRPQFLGTREEAIVHVERHLSLSDIVKASDEDLEWLYPGVDPEEVIRGWLARGPALVVVTRGSHDTLAVTASGVTAVPARRVEVVDTIGAGDAFMSGLIGGLLRAGLHGADARPALHAIEAETLSEVLDLATSCAAFAVGRSGAQPPRATEVGY